METESIKVAKDKLMRLRAYSRIYGISIQFSADKALEDYLDREIDPKLASCEPYQIEKNGKPRAQKKRRRKKTVAKAEK